MKALTFGVFLVLVAAGATLLLWWLGYWTIAIAVGIAVFVIGAVTYVATHAGTGGGRMRHT